MSALPVASQTLENAILHGDALEMLRDLPSDSVDAIVTDPPAGISFMGKGWDSNKGGRDAWIAWLSQVMAEALRVLKPGGHALVWALPRTSHWTAMALEDAGFEVRDCVTHLFGSGFPKSLDVSKALDKRLGATRQKTGSYKGATNIGKGSSNSYIVGDSKMPQTTVDITAPATDAARAWDGWGTALKPAAEFWWLCRKPLAEGTVAGNVLTWGTGALNIGASRVNPGEHVPGGGNGKASHGGKFGAHEWNGTRPIVQPHSQGRWPANLLLSHSLWCDETACALDCPVRALDAQSGIRPVGKGSMNGGANAYEGGWNKRSGIGYGDTGGASRYFTTFRYTAKASRSERNRGCSELPTSEPLDYLSTGIDGRGRVSTTTAQRNSHPTVKPLALMSWLIGLITPPGGVVLDPFAGSGSTLVAAKEGGWRYLGIEREAEYVAIAQARLSAPSTVKPAAAKPKRARKPKQPQPTLLEVSA